MTNTHLNEPSVEMLTGRKIASVGNDYIQLDNGIRIYLAEDEIKHLNQNNF